MSDKTQDTKHIAFTISNALSDVVGILTSGRGKNPAKPENDDAFLISMLRVTSERDIKLMYAQLENLIASDSGIELVRANLNDHVVNLTDKQYYQKADDKTKPKISALLRSISALSKAFDEAGNLTESGAMEIERMKRTRKKMYDSQIKAHESRKRFTLSDDVCPALMSISARQVNGKVCVIYLGGDQSIAIHQFGVTPKDKKRNIDFPLEGVKEYTDLGEFAADLVKVSPTTAGMRRFIAYVIKKTLEGTQEERESVAPFIDSPT